MAYLVYDYRQSKERFFYGPGARANLNDSKTARQREGGRRKEAGFRCFLI